MRLIYDSDRIDYHAGRMVTTYVILRKYFRKKSLSP